MAAGALHAVLDFRDAFAADGLASHALEHVASTGSAFGHDRIDVLVFDRIADADIHRLIIYANDSHLQGQISHFRKAVIAMR